MTPAVRVTAAVQGLFWNIDGARDQAKPIPLTKRPTLDLDACMGAMCVKG
jgi:hypothetical protein